MDQVVLPAGLSTPATLVLADRMERNLAGMAAFASAAGLALRPHAKTHKCVPIARRQLALGARGLSVATVGEAEALSGGQWPEPADVFIAYPLWAEGDVIGRLGQLTRHAQVTVGADSPQAVRRLAPLAGQVRVMVELDCGLRRSGVTAANAAGVAQAVQQAGLELAGIFTFPGHSYAPGAGAGAAADEARTLAEGAQILAAAGWGELERSGGSTPSAKLAHPGVLTELRPGVYVFNDAMQVELGTATMDEVALMVAATVVSKPAPGRLVLNAGSKVLGPDRPAWTTGHGRLADWPQARITGLWEHHAVVALAEPGPALGDVVAVVPNHACTAVNLVPDLLVVAGDQVVDRWPVDARAANR
ncbi:MAG TPA: alanine racemase [Streptosporangiaceae bacterium]|jgi:D-serine deaminase-like pyridoxal phosphate-dependent protein